MNFMLDEYDALPFGLLRHGKKVESSCGVAEERPKFVHCCPDPGQKVMPLDKVSTYASDTCILWRHPVKGAAGWICRTTRICARYVMNPGKVDSITAKETEMSLPPSRPSTRAKTQPTAGCVSWSPRKRKQI